ncbi:MAG: putative beta-lysine N-acetyltransferase [Desulfuromonadaceae bacterium]|nr:putative beta-lysine N-acetyltransferase [Desulfuromonas sp.]MDY0185932.1 putative beta-lysine N-acetyltransferase [Desulfuromonadaceae bacterium]
MSVDKIETIGQSVLQHGKANDRVYLMKLEVEECPAIIEQVENLALQNDYSKIFAKVPGAAQAAFEQAGYTMEASIPGFYQGTDTGVFLARYLKEERSIDPDAEQVAQVLAAAQCKASVATVPDLDTAYHSRIAAVDDCDEMAEVFAEVFASYPVPIHDPAFLRQAMEENMVYVGIWEDDRLLALAGAEMDRDGQNAEMTEFATLPECRGRGMAHQLLHRLEQDMPKLGIETCYTIARATSFGMNITFSQSGYTFGGTLVQNTQISGGLESMNVWFKPAPQV